MNHILKKTIQCVVSIFCVLGMIGTPGNTVKAENGFIYQSNGYSGGNNGEYSFPDGWIKASNFTGEGTFFFGYSSNENSELETTNLESINDSDISLTNNSNNDDVKARAITVSNNYVMLNTSNLSVGEYALTIKDSSIKVIVEKTYAILEDPDGNEYTLIQNSNASLKVGAKYTLKEVCKETVNGKENLKITGVLDSQEYLTINEDNGTYTIEPKEAYVNYVSDIQATSDNNRSFRFGYRIVSNSHIYQDNGQRTCDNDGCKPASEWRKSSNINGTGQFYLAYSDSDNQDITSSDLKDITDADVTLTNSNEEDVKSTAITKYSNYVELNINNLDVGEYTLTIKDSSIKVIAEKTYAILEDTDGNEYTLSQNSNASLKIGTKYTLKEVYKNTVNGKENLKITGVNDSDNYFNITQENGFYVLEPKEDCENNYGSFEVDVENYSSVWLSYKIIKKPSYVGTIKINDDNSFVITFDDEQVLNALSMNSNLYLNFDGNQSASCMLRNCIKTDSMLTISGDRNVISRSGGYVPNGKYSVSLQQENNTWYLKNEDGNELVTLNHDINKPIPSGLTYSLTEEEGFKLTCKESEACSVYLDTFYDTCMDSTRPYQDMYTNSLVYGYRLSGGAPFFAPRCPDKQQIFNKELNESGETTALVVPFDTFMDSRNTNFKPNINYSVTIHVLGYEDYNGNNFIYRHDYPNALPEGMTFDVKFDEENQKIVYITNSKELFEDSNLQQFELKGDNLTTEMKLSEEHTITNSDGLYYLTFVNDNWLSYLGGEVNVKLVHKEYGTVYAEHSITLSGITQRLPMPDDLKINIVGDGIVITTKDTEFIDKAVENLSVDLRSELLRPSEHYGLDNTKYPLIKINSNQVKIYINADELKTIQNDGEDTTLKFDINNAYYVWLYSDIYNGFNTIGSTSIFKQSLEPIILVDAINKTKSVNDLNTLDETATNLQNVTVVDTEENNTDVSIVGNVAGAITENYEQGNMDSDLNLLPDSDDSKETITVKTDISNLDTEEANELANKVGGEATTAIDVSISKEYTKDDSKNTEVTELPYDSVLTFNLPEASESESYVVVREHEESDGTTSYTLLDVTENEDGTGSVASSKFSKFVLVKQTIIEMVESPKSSTTEGSKTSLKFKTNKKATNVYLDNELVNPNNYEAKDDGTVTLKGEYVSKLSVGKHTLKIATNDGIASSEFEISQKSSNNSTTTKTTSGWDDGGPFTTDTCGNVYDRWNNKIYEATSCNVGGYNLVRTDAKD